MGLARKYCQLDELGNIFLITLLQDEPSFAGRTFYSLSKKKENYGQKN